MNLKRSIFTRWTRLAVVWIGSMSLLPLVQAQRTQYTPYFDEAYRKYPSVPQGLLEAVAFTRTRVNHVAPTPSCHGLPTYHGVMGLVEDGKGYFENNLVTVSELSGYSVEEIKTSPRINILAYAAAYASVQSQQGKANQRVESQQSIVNQLSEIPQDGSDHNAFACDQEFYGVLMEMQAPHTATNHRINRRFDFNQIFGTDKFKVIGANRITLEQNRIRSGQGDEFPTTGTNKRVVCTAAKQQADYMGALFQAANSRNYGSRNGAEIQHITIHTIQGSYASAISWFRNPRAGVSAHYVIRASDGQVTQMVCEGDKAFHVRDDNPTSIGIEHEGFIDDGAWYTNEMYQSSAALVKDLCKRHGIDPLKAFAGQGTNGTLELSNTCYHIKGHQHFPRQTHIDPGPNWDWNRYYYLINGTKAPNVFTANSGTIQDPGKNDNYPNQARETYLIKPQKKGSLILEFTTFELEASSDQLFDYIDIYDGENIRGRYIGRFSGKQSPGRIIANSGMAFLEFRSDCRVNRPGFALNYRIQAADAACGVPTDLAAKDVYPMGATLTWQGNADADRYRVSYRRRPFEAEWTMFETQQTFFVATGLAANSIYEWQVSTICDGQPSPQRGNTFVTPNPLISTRPVIYTVRSTTGKFNDTGGTTGGYTDKENYVYRILPADGGRVALTFTAFETEEDEDFLTIYDGTNLNVAKVLGKFSGKDRPGTITSSGNGMSIMFTSDTRVTAPGWEASWRSIGGTQPTTPSTPSPTPDPPVVVTDPDPVQPTPSPTEPSAPAPNPSETLAIGTFEPSIYLHPAQPRTQAELAASYSGSFELKFADRDRGGRGLANRFYLVGMESATGLRANPETGFFYNDFDKGLHPDWRKVSGNWAVQDQYLVQTNPTLDNTNLYTSLRQTNDEVYVYHWQAKMLGDTDNRRHGIHFFASDPAQEDRGTSYFVWIRDTDEADYVEIYKTVNNQFDRKVKKEITLEAGKAYDYKVVFNPKKQTNPLRGKIEVYIDNRFVASWVDIYPLSQGSGLSLRTGNSQVVWDQVEVLRARPAQVKVTTGQANRSDLTQKGAFSVRSLVIDRLIHWSAITTNNSTLGTSTAPSPPTTEPQPAPAPPNNPPASPGKVSIDLGTPGTGRRFVAVATQKGGQWTANPKTGFLFEDFDGGSLGQGATAHTGTWKAQGGGLEQTDGTDGNTNVYFPLTQAKGQTYVYQFDATLLEDGHNKRFGAHIYASTGTGKNRGNSYLAWFRRRLGSDDRAEVYRSASNNMPRFNKLAPATLTPGKAQDIKIVLDTKQNLIEMYLDNKKVLSWVDDRGVFRSGSFLSLRTGNAKVRFDNLRVYRAVTERTFEVSIGNQSTDMASPAGPAKLLILDQDANGAWQTPKTVPVSESR